MEILQANCFSCHSEEKKKGGLSLTSASALARGGDEGPVVVAGKPAASRLFQSLAPEADPHMPPKKQLAREDISAIERWIKAGAKWDARAFLAAEERIDAVQIQPLPASYRPVMALAWSPNDERLACGHGEQITILDTKSTNISVVTTMSGHTEGVQSLAWSADGQLLASGGFRTLTLRDAGTGQVRWSLTNGLAGRITGLAFVPGRDFLVAADSVVGQRGVLRLLDPGSGTVTNSWLAHGDSILGLDISADGRRMVTAGGDKLIKVWQWDRRGEFARLEGHGAAVLGVAFNSNATQVVSASADKELKVWDIETREKLINLGHHSAAVTAVLWVTNGASVLAATEAGGVFRYTDLKTHSGEQSSSSGNESKVADAGGVVFALAANRAGRLIAAGGSDGTIAVWAKNGKVQRKFSRAELEGERVAAQFAKAQPEGGKSESGSKNKDESKSKRKEEEQSKAKVGTEPLSFVRDVLPVLSKAGCNAGACHAKPEGQNGFKLSVFSYDPKADYGEIVNEARGRRIFPSAPDESLMLKKATLSIPHEGGERFKRGSEAHTLLVRWIREGMTFQPTNEPALVRIEATPAGGRYRKGAKQKVQVTAHYADGSKRDVTRLASFDSQDKEVATVDEFGQVKIGRLTGQGVIIARFMGFVADSKITVPAEKLLPDSKYAALPVHNLIDEQAYAHFKQLGLYPSEPCTDAEFLRRASLDTIGVLPTPAEVREFVGEPVSPTNTAPAAEAGKRSQAVVDRAKRRALIDRLLSRPAYADYWANRFADLLRPNPDRVGVKSIFTLDQWLRESFRENKPYDQFVREILTAEGSNHRDGPAVIYRDRREPSDLTTMFSQLFLGVRFECARCHHHPNEKWSQDDFYQFAAFFGPVKQKGAGLSPPISAGTETFYFAPGGAVKHPISGATMIPKPPDGPAPALAETADPRQALVQWLTAQDNPFFARAIVNRVWANFFGRGLVEPVDDFRISNPCVNPALLDALARDFATHGYDLKHLMRTILDSRIYQLSSEPNASNLADTRNFSRSYRRRLPAEVLLDAVNDVTGASDASSALPAGSRAMQMWSYKIGSQFLDAFGRPNSSSDCPCDRDLRTSVVQSLHLMHSRDLQGKLAGEKGRVRALVASPRTPEEIVTELYLLTLNRYPTSTELPAAVAAFGAKEATRQTATEDVLWALLNSAEFVFNH